MNRKKVLSSVIFVSIVIVLTLIYTFYSGWITSEKMILILIGFSVTQVLVLQYFYKNQLKNNFIVSRQESRIEELQGSLAEANHIAEYKSVYLENMSYEIRTPLSTVLGMLEMLKETDLDDNQRAQLRIAEFSSKHMSHLINVITENAEVESDAFKLHFEAMDLETDLTQLFKVFEYQAWEKGLNFEHQFLVEAKSKFLLLGDSIRIQQVLINLVNNAIKFTNSGKIVVIVDLTVAIEGNQIVSFYIKDTGKGMELEEVTQFQNQSTTYNPFVSKDYRGGGLGLSVSHKLIDLMGGELKLESKENEGSTFYFSLPLKKTLDLKLKNVETMSVLQKEFNVLVAEDNRMNQKVIKFQLESLGASCTVTNDGFEAVKNYQSHNFDMVLMDIYMPDMDGYLATEAIKNSKKYAENRIPIIGVSASAFEKDRENAKMAGIDDFLSKPIEIPKLKSLLIKYSEKQS